MGTREEASEARERLAEAVEKLADSDMFAAWLRARAAFHSYSFGNVCLIVSQRPDASRVAGYRAWQALGRQVRKGERAIKILAPCVRKVEDKETGEQARRVVAFRAVNVFDVSQTEGEPETYPDRFALRSTFLWGARSFACDDVRVGAGE